MLLKVYWGKLVILFMQILRASEDYLETMLMMQQQHGYIRSIDVAEHLGVTKPSVTYATKRLRENNFTQTIFKSTQQTLAKCANSRRSKNRLLQSGY